MSIKTETKPESVFEKITRKAYNPKQLWVPGKSNSAYYEEEFRLRDEFKADLFKELEIEDNPKAEKLFAQAWRRGHANGYSEIYTEACELVDLIN
jgi:hypothetical protein